MAVKASPETIRDMKKQISSTINDIRRISSGIRTVISATEKWDDTQAAQFNMIMQRVARLTEQPIEALNAALPKLEKLALSLEQYNQVKFNS